MTSVSHFEICTHLQLIADDSGCETSNRYRECSGKSYNYILQCINDYNAKYNATVSCTNDISKDATYIYL